MQVTRIILVLSLIFCVSAPTFAARAKKKPAIQKNVRSKKVRAKAGFKRKKPLVQPSRELSRKKPGEKTVAEKPAVEKTTTPALPELELEDTRWTDPIVLRDTLFLSASARHARTDSGPAQDKRSPQQR
jgi:hypothetical protein